MKKQEVLSLFEQVAEQKLSAHEACDRLSFRPFEQVLEGVVCDLHRELRTGFGETVFGPGKSVEQIKAAVGSLAGSAKPVLATKVSEEKGSALSDAFPEGTYHDKAGLFTLGKDIRLEPPYPAEGEVIVLTAGASDLSIGLEAWGCAQFFGLDAGFVSDSGVAGLHRLAPHVAALSRAKLLIVVAGMDGALPGVVAGLVGPPVIGVPTSVGYGAGSGGIAPLLTMLNSCAPGVTVVNIDNGYGAAAAAARFLTAFPKS